MEKKTPNESSSFQRAPNLAAMQQRLREQRESPVMAGSPVIREMKQKDAG